MLGTFQRDAQHAQPVGLKGQSPHAHLIPRVSERHHVMRVAGDGLGNFKKKEPIMAE